MKTLRRQDSYWDEMSMEHRCTVIDKENTKFTNKGLTLRHFVNHKSDMDWLTDWLCNEKSRHCDGPVTKLLSQGPASFVIKIDVSMFTHTHTHTFLCFVDRASLSTCATDGHLQVWWYQMVYNTIMTSWWWADNARNMYRHIINIL